MIIRISLLFSRGNRPEHVVKLFSFLKTKSRNTIEGSKFLNPSTLTGFKNLIKKGSNMLSINQAEKQKLTNDLNFILYFLQESTKRYDLGEYKKARLAKINMMKSIVQLKKDYNIELHMTESCAKELVKLQKWRS